uniref:Uncharacterized protein n=1 Tax=Arundo donax TaxID=35708 RepID=A0A0A8Z1F6_ARUDO
MEVIIQNSKFKCLIEHDHMKVLYTCDSVFHTDAARIQ